MVQPPNTVASYCVLARCPLGGAPEADDAAALAAYFNAATRFGALSDAWAEVDARYAAVRKVVGGARVLLQAREGKKREAGVGWRDWVAQKVGCRLAAGRRPRLATPPTHPSANFLSQDPLECLISFICSSNNSIPRITSMVERLCTDYGTRLACAASLGGEGDQPSRPYHAFPTLDQLAAASESAGSDATSDGEYVPQVKVEGVADVARVEVKAPRVAMAAQVKAGKAGKAAPGKATAAAAAAAGAAAACKPESALHAAGVASAPGAWKRRKLRG